MVATGKSLFIYESLIYALRMQYKILKNALKAKSSKLKAQGSQRFFKTGKGQYAEGDLFIGVTVPEIRLIAKTYPLTPLGEVKKLLKGAIHEERALGLIILVNRFNQADLKLRQKIFAFYLRNRQAVNNWDLVDLSAPAILGKFCFESGQHEIMDKLVTSKRHWDRRMAIVATLSFIRNHATQLTYHYAEKLLGDKEDLMHKATGWMLREAGKKDERELKKFLLKHSEKMPRTMLRYAIEKFSPAERQEMLKLRASS
jgi:3-methyladenine DNA glycosylase AlkD